MKIAEKIFSFLYNLMGWAIWLAVIAMLVFTGYIFATGYELDPEITVKSISVSELTDSQSASSSSNAYRVTVKINVTGATFSPYSYSVGAIKADTAALNGKMTLSDISAPVSVSLTAENTDSETSETGKRAEYSKVAPSDIEFSFTVNAHNVTENEVREELKKIGFRFSDMQTHFSLFDFPVTTGTPSFTLADA